MIIDYIAIDSLSYIAIDSLSQPEDKIKRNRSRKEKEQAVSIYALKLSVKDDIDILAKCVDIQFCSCDFLWMLNGITKL